MQGVTSGNIPGGGDGRVIREKGTKKREEEARGKGKTEDQASHFLFVSEFVLIDFEKQTKLRHRRQIIELTVRRQFNVEFSVHDF